MAERASETWEEYLQSFHEMTADQQQRALDGLSREQRAHFETMLKRDGTLRNPLPSGPPPLPRRGTEPAGKTVRFVDFEAQQILAPRLFSAGEYEDLGQAMEKMDRWLAEHEVDIINVETVVLPNMHMPDEDGTEDVSLVTSGELGTTWHQFFRLWYRE